MALTVKYIYGIFLIKLKLNNLIGGLVVRIWRFLVREHCFVNFPCCGTIKDYLILSQVDGPKTK